VVPSVRSIRCTAEHPGYSGPSTHQGEQPLQYEILCRPLGGSARDAQVYDECDCEEPEVKRLVKGLRTSDSERWYYYRTRREGEKRYWW
jgi:hypothetical protein